MAVIKCKECNGKMSDTLDICPHCGYKYEKLDNNDNSSKKRNSNKIILICIIVFVVLIGLITTGIIVHNNIVKERERQEQERYNKLPIKVDISMTSYFGTISYILEELDLDFDLVTMGANCLSGTQKNEFKTEKYGVLHTEFRYCKSNYTMVFRVYNDEKDQKLREAKPGELSKFSEYGYKIDEKKNIDDV